MAYVITNSRGTVIATIESGEDNTSATSITLLGPNYPSYGLPQNENFVYLLENFASPSPPTNPISGQLWFDTSTNSLNQRNTTASWTRLADDAYVQAQKISPVFTGTPTAPTPPIDNYGARLATTAFVRDFTDAQGFARLNSPAFVGLPTAPTAPNDTATTQIASTAFVRNVFNDIDLSLYAPKVSPNLVGIPTTPTAANNTATTQIASTAFVRNLFNDLDLSPYAPKNNPVLTGIPQVPTASVATNNNQIASTAFVKNALGNVDLSLKANIASPTFTGEPRAPTAISSDNSTLIATTQFVQQQKVSPALTGIPTAPTAAANTSTTQIATTEFVQTAVSGLGGGGRVDELAGSIKMWAGATPPANWALCNGQAVSRSVYPTLFARIGTTYGQGDGSTTFNLPNFTNRFGVGAGGVYTRGDTGGSANSTLVQHTHSATSVVNESPHSHGGIMRWKSQAPFPLPTIEQLQGGGPDGPPSSYNQPTDSASTNITVTTTVNSAGESGANANLPPYIACFWIIKISDDGSGGGTLQAGAGIDITTSGPFSTITNTGVRLLTAGTGITLSGSTGNIIISSSGGGGGGGGDTSRAGDVKWVAYGLNQYAPGWRTADGSAVSRTEFPVLFARIGTTYGAGDGSTTFNLPDLRGRFSLSAIDSAAASTTRVNAQRGAVGGSTDAVVVSHSHGVNDPGHLHDQMYWNSPERPFVQSNGSGPAESGFFANATNAGTLPVVRSRSASTGITINSAGESGTGKNVPPYTTLEAIIKMDDDSVNTGGILQAGPGISITTSGTYTTITNTIAQNPVVAGPGITVQNATGGALVSANVRNIISDSSSGIQVTNNNGVFTIGGGVGLGYNQSWQNFVSTFFTPSSQRQSNVNYTNTTGRPIMVVITWYRFDDAADPVVNLSVDGVVAAGFGAGVTTPASRGPTLSAVVPPDSVYRFNSPFGTTSLTYRLNWSELR